MSKSVTRIAWTVLISLAIVAGVYTSAQGASLWGDRTGSHLVSGARVNLDHYRSSQVAADRSGPASGHGCESESKVNPGDL